MNHDFECIFSNLNFTPRMLIQVNLEFSFPIHEF